jgi:hypothetical protein
MVSGVSGIFSSTTAATKSASPVALLVLNHSLTDRTTTANDYGTNLQKCDGLDSDNIETLPAADILASHRVVTADHVTLRLRKACPVAIVCSPWQLGLLPAYDPVNLVLPLLPAVRTGHHMGSLLCLLIKKVPFFHTAPHSVGDPLLAVVPLCHPA